MKLQDIDFGIGFGERIMLGIKDSKKPNCFKGQPIDITERFESVLLDYLIALKEERGINLTFTCTNVKSGKKTEYEIIYNKRETK